MVRLDVGGTGMSKPEIEGLGRPQVGRPCRAPAPGEFRIVLKVDLGDDSASQFARSEDLDLVLQRGGVAPRSAPVRQTHRRRCSCGDQGSPPPNLCRRSAASQRDRMAARASRRRETRRIRESAVPGARRTINPPAGIPGAPLGGIALYLLWAGNRFHEPLKCLPRGFRGQAPSSPQIGGNLRS